MQSQHSINVHSQSIWNNQLTDASAAITLVVGGSWSPASRVWPTMALLAFAEPSAHWHWPRKDNDEEVGLRWRHDCGEPQTMAHLLCCRLLDEPCSHKDLITATERAKACARKWQHIVWRTQENNNNRTAFSGNRPSAPSTTPSHVSPLGTCQCLSTCGPACVSWRRWQTWGQWRLTATDSSSPTGQPSGCPAYRIHHKHIIDGETSTIRTHLKTGFKDNWIWRR